MCVCVCVCVCVCTGKDEAIVLPGQLSDNIQKMSTSRGVSMYVPMCDMSCICIIHEHYVLV